MLKKYEKFIKFLKEWLTILESSASSNYRRGIAIVVTALRTLTRLLYVEPG